MAWLRELALDLWAFRRLARAVWYLPHPIYSEFPDLWVHWKWWRRGAIAARSLRR